MTSFRCSRRAVRRRGNPTARGPSWGSAGRVGTSLPGPRCPWGVAARWQRPPPPPGCVLWAPSASGFARAPLRLRRGSPCPRRGGGQLRKGGEAAAPIARPGRGRGAFAAGLGGAAARRHRRRRARESCGLGVRAILCSRPAGASRPSPAAPAEFLQRLPPPAERRPETCPPPRRRARLKSMLRKGGGVARTQPPPCAGVEEPAGERSRGRDALGKGCRVSSSSPPRCLLMQVLGGGVTECGSAAPSGGRWRWRLARPRRVVPALLEKSAPSGPAGPWPDPAGLC